MSLSYLSKAEYQYLSEMTEKGILATLPFLSRKAMWEVPTAVSFTSPLALRNALSSSEIKESIKGDTIGH